MRELYLGFWEKLWLFAKVGLGEGISVIWYFMSLWKLLMNKSISIVIQSFLLVHPLFLWYFLHPNNTIVINIVMDGSKLDENHSISDINNNIVNL